MTDKKTMLILASGGVDSTAVIVNAVENDFKPALLFIGYGQKHESREFQALINIKRELGERKVDPELFRLPFGLYGDLEMDLPLFRWSEDDLPDAEGSADERARPGVIPFRNGILLSIAATIADKANVTHIGAGIQGDLENEDSDNPVFPDTSLQFVKSMSQAIRAGTEHKVALHVPFVDKKKFDVIRMIHDEAPYLLEYTYSCYKGREHHCGVCSACKNRKAGFAEAHIPDPTIYEVGE